jgi:hypothetical protein
MRPNLAVLVQPPGRGERIARALESHGYRVALHRDLPSARRCLRRVRAVAVLFVDHGEHWFAGNDLLSCAEEFPSLRGTRIFVTLANPNSVFAAALRARRASVLVHPVSAAEVAAIARGEEADEGRPRWTAARYESVRLRDRAESLRSRTIRLVQEARKLRHDDARSRRSPGR